MSFRLSAPMPSGQTTTQLPSPQLSDVKARRHSIDIFRAIDGTKRTSVKSNNRYLLTYTFDLTRLKAEELIAFLKSYHSSQIGIHNHNAENWLVYLSGNPVVFNGKSRNSVTVQVQFEGEKVS